MRVSTRGRYGLRAMLELARSFGDAPVVMADLAQREGLSRKYLHTLLTGLKAAGLARSVRGAGGGFVLARDPSEIKLKEILHALEGSLCLVDCVEDERTCDRANGCTARGVWQELSGAIENVLEDLTLADVIATERERKSGTRGAGSDPCGKRSGGRR
jgi:Rrf2 family protein